MYNNHDTEATIMCARNTRYLSNRKRREQRRRDTIRNIISGAAIIISFAALALTTYNGITP